MQRTSHAEVIAVCSSAHHTFSKTSQDRIRLVEGWGVEGDAHAGTTVKHRSRVRRDPDQPNLRQVHLVHAELHEELRQRGYDLRPGQMGENITTRGVALLALPAGTRLHLGEACVMLTGLRNPCVQLEQLGTGLMQALLDRDEEGALVRKAGVMGVVLRGGEVSPGSTITVELPPLPHAPLAPV